MNLYLISQRSNNDYDTYSDAVVAAETAEDARVMYPRDGKSILRNPPDAARCCGGHWVTDPKLVKVKLIGVAKLGTKRRVICASYHAG